MGNMPILARILFVIEASMRAFRTGFKSFRRQMPHTLEGLGVALHHGAQSRSEPTPSGRHKSKQYAIGGGRSDQHAAADPNTGLAHGAFAGSEISGCEHEAGASALGKFRPRDVGIAPAQLIPAQEYEIGAVRAGRYADGAIRFSARFAIDQARHMRGVPGGLGRSHKLVFETLCGV